MPVTVGEGGRASSCAPAKSLDRDTGEVRDVLGEGGRMRAGRRAQMRPARKPRAQRGAALMAMLAVLILGAAWWTVTALSTPINRTASERAHNARILQEAKSALIGYVAHAPP